MKYVLLATAFVAIALIAALNIIGSGREPLTELYFSNYSDLPTVSTHIWPKPLVVEEQVDNMSRNLTVITTRTDGMITVTEQYQASAALLRDKNFTQLFPGRIRDVNGTVTALYRVTRNEPDPEQNVTLKFPFSFVIHNLEGANQDYVYIVSQTYNNKTEQVMKDSVSLVDGGTAAINATASATRPFGRMEVNVGLIGQPQTIHFWIEEQQ